ncbi:MAG: hypothetical protein L3J20_07180 [Flavobacteriaceae bacterium]|nr:hypothetical protein [Flavobacteriaceae bacterium]
MTTKKAVFNTLLVIIIGVLVVFASRMPFIHKNYEFVNSINSSEYKAHRATYKSILENRTTLYGSLLNALDEGTIAKEEYVVKLRKAQKESELALYIYGKEKKALKESYKYNGFNAYYLFLLNIGTPILAFVICLFFIYSIFNPITSKIKKTIFSIYSSIFLFSSSYMILHALYADKVYSSDFPENWYVNIMTYTPVIIALTIPLLFYHFQTIEEKLKGIIAMFFDVIYKDIPNSDFIKPEKEKEYRNLKIKITDKVVGNE